MAAQYNASDTNNIAAETRKNIPKIEKQKTKWKKRTPESLKQVLSSYNYIHDTIRKKSKKSGLSDRYVGYVISATELKCILEQLESEEPAKIFKNCPSL